MTGQRTDVKSPAILLPFAVCYESPWSPSIPAPIFMGSIDVWPEVCADGWIHVRIAGRLGLRLPLALAFLASFGHFAPLPPHPSSIPFVLPYKLDFHSECDLSFQFLQLWLVKYRRAAETPLLRTRVCGPCQPLAARVLGRERAISWTAVGRGEWLSWFFHLAPLERTL